MKYLLKGHTFQPIKQKKVTPQNTNQGVKKLFFVLTVEEFTLIGGDHPEDV